MKKVLLCIVGFCMVALPVSAEMNFYRTANGQLIAEATDCNSAARLSSLVHLIGLPDDPPGGTTPEGTTPEGQDEDPTQPDANVVQGISTITDALLGGDPEEPREHGISRDLEAFLDEASFDERQDSFLTFVRDVNWKTGMYITFRDYNIFRRIRMACQGINQLTKPMRVNLGNYGDALDASIEKAADYEIDALAQAARAHSFTAMSKLSVLGLAIAIEKENPFLLLAMDEETYNKLVEVEPKISTLFEDMYTFFAIRSVRMGDYDSNTKALIKIAKLGKGDSFNTWHVMAEYGKKMLELQRQNKLTVEDEKNIHIWRLQASMTYIKEQVRIEERAADLAIEDPQNAQLVREVANGPKKKPSLDDKARELLRKSTQDEIKHLIQKYKAK